MGGITYGKKHNTKKRRKKSFVSLAIFEGETRQKEQERKKKKKNYRKKEWEKRKRKKIEREKEGVKRRNGRNPPSPPHPPTPPPNPRKLGDLTGTESRRQSRVSCQ